MEEKLKKAMDMLEEKDRKLIQMRCFDGCTQNETAEALGMTPAEVSRRERVLVTFIRRQVQNHGDLPVNSGARPRRPAPLRPFPEDDEPSRKG